MFYVKTSVYSSDVPLSNTKLNCTAEEFIHCLLFILYVGVYNHLTTSLLCKDPSGGSMVYRL